MIRKRPTLIPKAWLASLKLTRPFRHAIDRQLARVRLAFRVEEIAFVLLGGVIGLFAGIAVVMMARILELMHELLFAIERGTLLGAGPGVGPLARYLCPNRWRLGIGDRDEAEWAVSLTQDRGSDRSQCDLWRTNVAARQPRRRA
jgi:hypothetical protein